MTYQYIEDFIRNTEFENMFQHYFESLRTVKTNHKTAQKLPKGPHGSNETNLEITDGNGNGLQKKAQQHNHENADGGDATNLEISDGNGNGLQKKAQQSTHENVDGGNETNPEIPDGNGNGSQKKTQESTDRESGKAHTENNVSTSNSSAAKKS